MKKFAILMALALVASLLVFYGGQTAKAFHAAGGPVAYWPFDDGSDPTAELAHGNSGVLVGTAAFQSGADFAPVPSNANSLSLDGSGARVEVSDAPVLNPTDAVTVSAWIKPAAATQAGYTHLVFKGANLPFNVQYLLAYDPTGTKARFLVADGPGLTATFYSAVGTTVLSDTTHWYHLAGTYDKVTGETKIYVDSSLEGTSTGPTGSTISGSLTGAEDLGIGSNANDGITTWAFYGLIDEVQIYDRALSLAEVGFLTTFLVDDDGLVGPSGCDDTGITVFSSIQDAVDFAYPGATINVCPGTYTENVDVTTDDLIIVSTGGSSVTTVDGSGAADEVFDVTADGVTIQGFEIMNGGSDGGIRFEGEDNLFTENHVHDNTLYGIVAWDHGLSNDNTITMNDVHDNARSGILIGHLGNSGNVVSQNEVYNNGAVWMGIELINSFEGLIEDNEVYSDPGTTGRYGIAIVDWTKAALVGSNTVSGNEVYGTGSGGGFTSAGILVMAWAGGGIVHGHPCAPDVTFTGNVIEDNDVHDNDGRGIRVWAIQNDPYSVPPCGDDGFITDNAITGNTVADNALEGIILTEGADDNSVHRNTVVDNDDGIHVDGDDNSVHHNTANSNDDDGIHVDGDGNTIHHNTACSNAATSILIESGATANVVHHNTATITDVGTGTVKHHNTACT